MEKILKFTTLGLLACAFASCESQEESELPGNDEVEVQFSIAGNYGNPFAPSSSSRADYTGFGNYVYNFTNVKPVPLPEGSTMWLLLETLKDDDGEDSADTFTDDVILRQFVVDNNGLLMPCRADDNGVLIERTTQPLYLKRGQKYRARVIGPARKLEDNYSMYITNNQYVYAHDYRYEKTEHKVFIVNYDKPVEKITLNPVIHQNAELQFTIEAENETYTYEGKEYEYSPVHTLEVMPAGVVVTGLQEHYELNGTDGEGNIIGEPYNWTLGKNYLIAYPGHVNNYMTIYEPTEVKTNPLTLVFKGAIMPTDAVANPIIVGFYLRVNGVPTMFQMMLNRKMFLHAYNYHYKGKLKIQHGIAVLEWQTVTRDAGTVDLPVLQATE